MRNTQSLNTPIETGDNVMNKYGFVYLWYDRKHQRFYVGSHWGTEDDGYVCSSSWMNRAYKIRPEDFKRRILSRIYTSKADLLDKENSYLITIKPHELKEKYYNLRNHEFGHWSTDEQKSILVKQKTGWNRGLTKHNDKRILKQSQSISISLKGKRTRSPWTEEQKKYQAQLAASQNPNGFFKGRKHSEETKEKMRKAKIGKASSFKGKHHTEETKNKISLSKSGKSITKRKTT